MQTDSHMATTAAADGKAHTAPHPISPEEAQRRAEQSRRMAAAFGEIVSVLMRADAYRVLTLAHVERLVVPAVITGQFSLAEAQSKENGFMAPIGVVLWASVSPEIDAKLAASANAIFELDARQWRSGENIWLVDAVGDQRVIGAMLQQLQKAAWHGRTVKARMRATDGQIAVQTLSAPPQSAPA